MFRISCFVSIFESYLRNFCLFWIIPFCSSIIYLQFHLFFMPFFFYINFINFFHFFNFLNFFNFFLFLYLSSHFPIFFQFCRKHFYGLIFFKKKQKERINFRISAMGISTNWNEKQIILVIIGYFAFFPFNLYIKWVLVMFPYLNIVWSFMYLFVCLFIYLFVLLLFNYLFI